MFADCPKPPYYAVIFSSKPKLIDEAYEETVKKLHSLACLEDGFLGMDSAFSDIEITVSYWRDLESIKRWKNQRDHVLAQAEGRKIWYTAYNVKIAYVERAYDFIAE